MTARAWTSAAVGDLSDRVAIVTGASSGIGLETARVLAEHGATTIIAARNELKAARAAHSIRQSAANAMVETRSLDVADSASIHRFADELSDEYDEVDLLINNAGIMLVPYGLTADGDELQLGTNHLGHFALTGLLLPLLEAAEAARVVTVSSLAHRRGEFDSEDLHYGDGSAYESMAAYRRSKLANLMFAYELDRRLRASGSSVSSLAAHPGLSNTNLGSHLSENWWWRIVRPAVGLLTQGAAVGALPTLRAATDPQAIGGQYYGPSGRGEVRGAPVPVESSPRSHDLTLAAELWESSVESTGVRYL